MPLSPDVPGFKDASLAVPRNVLHHCCSSHLMVWSSIIACSATATGLPCLTSGPYCSLGGSALTFCWSSVQILSAQMEYSTLLHQAVKICTDAPDREKKHVAQALHNNGYPRSLAARDEHPSTSLPCNLDKDLPKATVTLPYILHLTDCIRKDTQPIGDPNVF